MLTDVTDDVIRKGIDGEHYSMIWTNVCWGVAILYGVFAGIWAMARFGARDTLLVGLAWFALGNLLCGAAIDVPTLAAAKLVEGVGKGMVIVICRSLLYRQFDRMVIVAIGFYGVIAYATRPTTPLLTALVNDALSWRWIFWVNVPLALLAFPLVLRFIKPDRPPRPLPLRIDWIGVTLFAAWIVSLTFVFGWYRKWGGWTSNAFTATALLALVLPVALVAWVGSGLTASEHLRRMFRVRVYVLAMCVAHADAAATAGGADPDGELLHRAARLPPRSGRLDPGAGDAHHGALDLPDHLVSSPRAAALLAARRRRRLRRLPVVDVLRGQLHEQGTSGLDDRLLGAVRRAVPSCLPARRGGGAGPPRLPVWRGGRGRLPDRPDRGHPDHDQHDRFRLDRPGRGRPADEPARNRPEVQESSARVADYYRQRGVEGPESAQMTSTVLGGFVKTEAVAHGIQSGLRFLSLIVGGIGLLVTALLARGGDPVQPVPAMPSRPAEVAGRRSKLCS